MKNVRVLKNQPALDILKEYNIPTFNYRQISGAHEVSRFPAVLKVDSPAILHKSERKAVHVVHHKDHAQKSFNSIRKHGQVLSQQHVDGHHFALQIACHSRGSPTLFLGSSGASSEVHNDFSTEKCPVDYKTARKMITGLKTYNYVREFNSRKTKLEVLEEALVALSRLAVHENIQSLEIDPFIVNHKFGGAADAKIVLKNDR